MTVGGIQCSRNFSDVFSALRCMSIKCQNERRIQIRRRHPFSRILCKSQFLSPEILAVFHLFSQHRKVNASGQVNPLRQRRHHDIPEREILLVLSPTNDGHPNPLQFVGRKLWSLRRKAQHRGSYKLPRHREKHASIDIRQHQQSLPILLEVRLVTAGKCVNKFQESRKRNPVLVFSGQFLDDFLPHGSRNLPIADSGDNLSVEEHCLFHSCLAFYYLVARHGIEPYPLAFQTSTLPSSSRAKLWWTVRDSNSHFTVAGRGSSPYTNRPIGAR